MAQKRNDFHWYKINTGNFNFFMLRYINYWYGFDRNSKNALIHNCHMNDYDCEEKISSEQLIQVCEYFSYAFYRWMKLAAIEEEQMRTGGDFIYFLIGIVNVERVSCQSYVKTLTPSAVDALLVDITNFMASCVGMDLGWYTSGLDNDEENFYHRDFFKYHKTSLIEEVD